RIQGGIDIHEPVSISTGTQNTYRRLLHGGFMWVHPRATNLTLPRLLAKCSEKSADGTHRSICWRPARFPRCPWPGRYSYLRPTTAECNSREDILWPSLAVLRACS